MTAGLPKLSIITPTLNRRRFLEDAIQSVLSQDYPEFEHIIVDGGSNDGTLELLAQFPHLRVVSEKDSGLYDALSKGVAMARGEVIGHLNSDDVYAPGAFHRIAAPFRDDAGVDAVFGGAIAFEDTAGGARRTVVEYLTPSHSALSWENVTIGVPIVNARFFRRGVYDRVGTYDARYRIAADRDFLIRVALADVRSVQVPGAVYHYRMHGGSLSLSGERASFGAIHAEHLTMSERYLAMRGLSRAHRAHFERWHANEAMLATVLATREFRFHDAFQAGLRGWRQDALWPLFVASKVIPRIARMPFRRAHAR